MVEFTDADNGALLTRGQLGWIAAGIVAGWALFPLLWAALAFLSAIFGPT
jgi:hypothetical protein